MAETIITLAEARAQGFRHYFTGMPCKHGHVVKRRVSTRNCVECTNIMQREWRRLNPDKVRETQQRYHQKPNWKRLHAAREYQRRRRIDAKRARQVGHPKPLVCELCGRNGGKIGVVFDHCHVSGNFRGWLCGNCNKVLGLVKDSPELLRKLAWYLEKGK